MLTTLRRDRRTRRQANFTLESLDDRLVLSAGTGGAAAEAAGVKAAAIEHRHEVQAAKHEARLARAEAKHEAKLARAEAKHAAHAMPSSNVTPVTINASGSASASTPTASASAAPQTAAPAASASNGSSNLGSYTSAYGVSSTSTGSGFGTTGTGSGSTGTGSGSTGSGSSSPGPLPANVAAALQSLYQEYESAGGGSSFTPSQPSDKLLEISGTSVGVSLTMASNGDFNTFLSQLQSDGLSVSTSSATYGTVNGMLPIADLPAVAEVAANVNAAPPPTQL